MTLKDELKSSQRYTRDISLAFTRGTFDFSSLNWDWPKTAATVQRKVTLCKRAKFEFETRNDLHVFLFFIGFVYKENLSVPNRVKLIQL